MRINFILPGLGNSGGIQIVKRYAELFNERGVDTVIYCPILADNLHRYPSMLKNIIHQIYCTIKTIKERRDAPYVKWVLRINNATIRKADCTVATMWATSYKVAKLKEKCGKKWYFIQGFEVWDNWEYGLNSYKLPLNKIVISSWINVQLKNVLHIGPFPILYNGVDLKKFNSRERTAHEEINFLMLNHRLKKKGVIEGLKALERIQKKYSKTNLRMFGMCDSENIPDYIEYFQDPSKDMLLYLYRDTDIFIFPSLEEGWGLTAIEAMACGCAVVGTRTGFVLDLGKHMENMMISEPGDVEGMVNNIIILMENPELRLKIATAGSQVVAELNWQNSANAFIEILLGEF